jgi:predicted cupin superfamily sugar epimerase
MEKWLDSNGLEIDIESIDGLTLLDGDLFDRGLFVDFTDQEKTKWQVGFIDVCNYRSLSNTSIKGLDCSKSENSSIYFVEKSKYKKHFERQTREDLTHFFILDKLGAGLELLTPGNPTVSKVILDEDVAKGTEQWCAYKKLNVDIEFIAHFIGGNQELTVIFEDADKERGELYFEFVWDFRYANENAFIGRNYDRSEISSIYLVENSKYIKYFEQQVSSTLPVEDLKHFLIFDKIDTGLEVLTSAEPILRKVD